MSALRELLERYADALNNELWDDLQQLYAEQFVLLAPGSARCVANDASFRAMAQQAGASYRGVGLRSIALKTYSEEALDENFALLRAAWAARDAEGQEKLTIDYTYIVQQGAGGPKIAVAIGHNEYERLQEHGLEAAETPA